MLVVDVVVGSALVELSGRRMQWKMENWPPGQTREGQGGANGSAQSGAETFFAK